MFTVHDVKIAWWVFGVVFGVVSCVYILLTDKMTNYKTSPRWVITRLT